MGMVSEFKEFAMKGNVVDMAVGIVIGAAFGKIVASLVKDIIMPPVGLALGGVDFSDLAIVLQEAQGAVSINYGTFIMTILDFLIIALAIFMAIKAMNTAQAMRSAEEPEPEPEAEPEPSTEEKLLTEIRDLLAAKS